MDIHVFPILIPPPPPSPPDPSGSSQCTRSEHLSHMANFMQNQVCAARHGKGVALRLQEGSRPRVRNLSRAHTQEAGSQQALLHTRSDFLTIFSRYYSLPIPNSRRGYPPAQRFKPSVWVGADQQGPVYDAATTFH